MKNLKDILIKKRDDIPALAPSRVLILFGAVLLLSAFAAVGAGGLVFLFLAGALYAYLILGMKSPLPLILIPLAFGISFLVSQSIEDALWVILVFVPVGYILAYCVYQRKNLSVTTIMLTVAIGAVLSLMVIWAAHETYHAGIIGSVKQMAREMNTQAREYLAGFKIPQSETESFSLTEEMIDGYMEMVIMILPAVCIVTCQILGYISAKLFRLLVLICGTDEVFFKTSWAVSLGTPAAAIYLVSLFASMFIPVPVISYSAINLMMIIMPAACIVGFRGFFGNGGLLRRPMKKSTKTGLIIVLAVLFFMAPSMLTQVLALFACFGAVARAWMLSKIRKGRN
ncbi:MAG: hypothetical protein E7575_02675 [Ruminococcaceae bacterium]|nr:hypothetical protein [Oscillospiraceae bacterium]